jgi:hypothetical protein
LLKEKPSSALLSATGRNYAEWFQLLDAWGAPGRAYREIADWLPACQLPTGSSPCTSLSANSSIMLPPSMISTSAARSAVPNGITKSDSRECAGHAPVISAAVCAGVHRVLVNQSMASPRIRLT